MNTTCIARLWCVLVATGICQATFLWNTYYLGICTFVLQIYISYPLPINTAPAAISSDVNAIPRIVLFKTGQINTDTMYAVTLQNLFLIINAEGEIVYKHIRGNRAASYQSASDKPLRFGQVQPADVTKPKFAESSASQKTTTQTYRRTAGGSDHSKVFTANDKKTKGYAKQKNRMTIINSNEGTTKEPVKITDFIGEDRALDKSSLTSLQSSVSSAVLTYRVHHYLD